MSARQWVADTQPKAPVAWRRLEQAAFADHPAVLDELQPGRKFGGRSQALQLVWGIPAVIVMAAVYAAPIWGFTTLVGDRFGRNTLDPEGTVPAAGIIFAVGLVGLIVGIVRWMRAGRLRSGIAEGQGAIALVFGVLSIPIVAVLGSSNDVELWALSVLPIALSAVLGAVFLVLLVTARRAAAAKARGAGLDPKLDYATPLARVTDRVHELPIDAQNAVRADILAAVADLQATGAIAEDDAQAAREAELGLLTMRMYQHSRAKRAR